MKTDKQVILAAVEVIRYRGLIRDSIRHEFPAGTGDSHTYIASHELNEETGLSDADVIAAAVGAIQQRGWFQGSYYGPSEDKPIEDCPVCGLGALSLIVYGDPVPPLGDESVDGTQFRRCRDALNYAVRESGFDGWVSWQDQYGRTWDEVETKMLEVVAELKSK